MSSLSAVADGDKPDTPPLLGDLVMWGYANGQPPELTAIGKDFLSELQVRMDIFKARQR